MLLGTSDIVSFISNTSREYKYFYFRRFNNYTIVFISEIVIQNYYFTDADNCIIVETSEIKIFILPTSVGNK